MQQVPPPPPPSAPIPQSPPKAGVLPPPNTTPKPHYIRGESHEASRQSLRNIGVLSFLLFVLIPALAIFALLA